MYSDEDLDKAVEKGVFSSTSVDEFRDMMTQAKGVSSVDEENFKLIGGFNDIFIVIACILLLASSLWVLSTISPVLGYFVFSALSWALAEVFVLKRKMALPAIVLLFSFVGGVFWLSEIVFSSSTAASVSHEEDYGVIISIALAAIATYCHWRRFRVPITVALGTAVALMFLVATVLAVLPNSTSFLLWTSFFCGCITFATAMYWDSSDTTRTTHKSDVAFWLHLLSAPLIIHPTFMSLGILDGGGSISAMLIIILLYAVMTTISIAIDRRAFMVSSLVYVIYAVSSLIENYGGVGQSFALTGVVMGASLLLLSIYWHKVRVMIVNRLPDKLQGYLPASK